VNNFSIDVGPEGEKAVNELIARAEDSGIIPKIRQPVFI
jgi:predicted solute-binding protein